MTGMTPKALPLGRSLAAAAAAAFAVVSAVAAASSASASASVALGGGGVDVGRSPSPTFFRLPPIAKEDGGCASARKKKKKRRRGGGGGAPPGNGGPSILSPLRSPFVAAFAPPPFAPCRRCRRADLEGRCAGTIASASSGRTRRTTTQMRPPRPLEGAAAAALRSSVSAEEEGTVAREEEYEYDVQVLCEDPRVYVVRDLLSAEECRAYIERASALSPSSTADDDDNDDSGDGEGDSDVEVMSRSNAPEVSLDASRLWPLPFLCLGAGVPPVIRLAEGLPDGTSPSLEAILSAALPPVVFAAALTSILAWSVTQLVRTQAESSSRTSEAAALNSQRDVEFIRPLLDRVSSKQVSGGHPWTAFEAPVVTRYRPGAVFAVHNDASPTRGSEWSELGGQRVVTVICYLNDCPRGGGTRFDRLGITVQPRAGSALVFFPSDRETLRADDRTRHESLPAVEEKWIVQLFGRVGPRVPPPLGIPDSFGEQRR